MNVSEYYIQKAQMRLFAQKTGISCKRVKNIVY